VVWLEPALREECCVNVSVAVELMSAAPLRDRSAGKQNAIPASSQLTGGTFLKHTMPRPIIVQNTLVTDIL
jgi:hypothetical protein